MCEPLGSPGTLRQVPKSQARLLRDPVPASLAKINSEVLKRDVLQPHQYKVQIPEKPVPKVSWNDTLSPSEFGSNKRFYPGPKLGGVTLRPESTVSSSVVQEKCLV
jgi:hypothetical protein